MKSSLFSTLLILRLCCRTGRNKNQGIPSTDFGAEGANMQHARAILEIVGTSTAASGLTDPGVIAVGEDTTLMITGYLPRKHINWKADAVDKVETIQRDTEYHESEFFFSFYLIKAP